MEGKKESPSTSTSTPQVSNLTELDSSVKADHSKSVNNKGTGRVKPKLNQERRKPQTARDRERLDAGRRALRELLIERRQKKSRSSSIASLLKLYLTIIGALLIIGGLVILLFLVPMTIDPALATINYDIDVHPAICMTLSSLDVKKSKTNFWCSCTEGCTKDIFVCPQIVVAYRKEFLELPKELQGNFNQTAYYSITGLLKPSYVDEGEEKPFSRPVNSQCDKKNWEKNPSCWTYLNASLYINVKGCGYPPQVNCSNFIGNYNKTGRRFLCYYSKRDPYIVIVNYDPNEPWDELIQSLGWTVGAQIAGAFMIFILHCPFKSSIKSIIKKSQTTKLKMSQGTSFKDKIRQPIFQRDWYDVHT